MKKILLFVLLGVAAFAENFILDNQTDYPLPEGKSKMAIQWAASAREVQEKNEALIQAIKLNPDALQALSQQGKVKLNIPKQTEYFRVLVWPKGKGSPEFLTNWVEVIPNTTYLLTGDHLVPAVLMIGMGC